MSSFNQRIHQIKIKNYYTKPVNETQFDNPYLLKSDTKALNAILAQLRKPIRKQETPTPSVMTATPEPNPLPGITPIPTVSTPDPQDADTEERDQNVHEHHQADSGTTNQDHGDPLPTSGGGNTIPDVEGDTQDLDDYADESGDENLPSRRQGEVDPPDEMDDEGHGEIRPTETYTNNGSLVSSGSGLIVNGKINRNIGLPDNLSQSLVTSNGQSLRQVRYNPTSGKFTLFYGTRLASGRFPRRVELTPPTDPPHRPSLLDRIRRAVGPSGGANYMLDRSLGRPSQP